MNWDLHILYTCLCYVCFYYVCFYYMCLKCIWSLETQRNWGRLYHKRRWTSNSFQTWIWVGGTTTGDGIHLRRDGIRFEEFVSGPSRTLFIWDTQMNLSGLYHSRRWDSFEWKWDSKSSWVALQELLLFETHLSGDEIRNDSWNRVRNRKRKISRSLLKWKVWKET